MKALLNQFCLVFILLKTLWYFFCEERKVRLLFYHNPKFRQQDRALKRAYRFSNPYRMNKRFLKQLGYSEVDTYGETSLTTLAQIVRKCEISPQDHVVELGCGRGRGLFFLSHFIGCSATGIEWHPEFAARAQKLGGNVICADMLDTDFSKGTVIYLFGTCLPDATIERLIQRFDLLPATTKIITVSFALTDYSSKFRVVKEFDGRFPWGETSIFWNQKSFL
jgi:SAM-dependent methyltransferase